MRNKFHLFSGILWMIAALINIISSNYILFVVNISISFMFLVFAYKDVDEKNDV